MSIIKIYFNMAVINIPLFKKLFQMEYFGLLYKGVKCYWIYFVKYFIIFCKIMAVEKKMFNFWCMYCEVYKIKNIFSQNSGGSRIWP